MEFTAARSIVENFQVIAVFKSMLISKLIKSPISDILVVAKRLLDEIKYINKQNLLFISFENNHLFHVLNCFSLFTYFEKYTSY